MGVWGGRAVLVIAAIATIVAIIGSVALSASIHAYYNRDFRSVANYYNTYKTALEAEYFLGLIMAIGFSLAFMAVSNVGSYYNSNVIKYSALALIVLYLLSSFMFFIVDLTNIADILNILVFVVGLQCAWEINRIS